MKPILMYLKQTFYPNMYVNKYKYEIWPYYFAKCSHHVIISSLPISVYEIIKLNGWKFS